LDVFADAGQWPPWSRPLSGPKEFILRKPGALRVAVSLHSSI